MKKTIIKFLFSMLIATFLLGLPSPAAAQDDQDPPGRVARINYMQGSVSFQAAGETDWVDAIPNRPLTIGDNLWSDKSSRAELHIGSTAIRMAAETGISFLNLDDRTIQVQLAQGAIEVHVRNLEAGEAFEVDTPNLAFTLSRSGEYLIETSADGDSTLITVREGEGEVTGGGESYDLEPGQRYVFRGTEQLSYEAQGAPRMGNFEDWCQERDQRENSSPSARYVSRDIDGYYDLDDYGDWRSAPEYGQMWVPRGVAVGWAPYRFGHWVWIAPWGWTWVEDEPWGFAPFHYGRWAYVGGYWGWVPGPLVVRPVYAPALVAFVGGGGVGVAVGFGGGISGVAWFPLGPRDVYIPGYRASARYVEHVNITNTTVINRTYVTTVYNNYQVNHVTNIAYTHQNVAGAVTVVSRETFVSARPVGREIVRVSPEQIRTARAVEEPPLAPTRSSYISATARVTVARPAVAFNQRPVVAKINPRVPASRERVPQYTNDRRPFNQEPPPAARGEKPQPPPRVNEAPPPARVEHVNPPPRGENPQPPARVNEAPPPARVEHVNPPPPQPNNADRPARAENPPPPAQPHSVVKPSPPVKAREDRYDVHPPLNQKPAEQPKKEERKQTPPPKSDPKDKDTKRPQ
ncbi:MAG: DUF6600 domain-containing protein [Candidatus Acidiferrales bacterium]